MDLMVDIYDNHIKDKAAAARVDDGPALAADDLIVVYKKQIIPMMEQVYDQREKLAREVEKWCQERGV